MAKSTKLYRYMYVIPPIFEETEDFISISHKVTINFKMLMNTTEGQF